MNESYNLVSTNWIPVIPKAESRPILVGLAEMFANASRLQTVSANTPLETAALYRLLLALLQAGLDVSDDGWKVLWHQKTFPESDIMNYLERWKHRLNLFDASRPFYQDASLEGKPEPVSSLSGHVASGADATLFNHNTQGQLSLPAKDATLALLSIQAFGLSGTKGGGKSFTDGPCARGMVLLLEGDSLFETLMLNLFDRHLPSHRLKHQESDRPAWEMDNPFEENARRPYGFLDHLTWHNRRVKLLQDRSRSDGLYVREMLYDIGLRTSDAVRKSVRDVFNPMYYWRANTRQKTGGEAEGRSHSPVYFQAEKAMWRDSAVLLNIRREHVDEADKAPAALEQAQMYADDGVLDWSQTFRLQAFGACTESGKDKTFYYRHEALPLPLSLLRSDDRSLFGHLAEALGAAQRTRDVLNSAVLRLARLILKPSLTEENMQTKLEKEERDRVIRLANSWGAERYFWADLEPYFHRMIQDLSDQSEKAVQTWRNEVRRAATTAFWRAESCTTTDRRAQRAVALTHQWFNIELAAAVGKADIRQPEEGGEEE